MNSLVQASDLPDDGRFMAKNSERADKTATPSA
jgi:hypothetical protein